MDNKEQSEGPLTAAEMALIDEQVDAAYEQWKAGSRNRLPSVPGYDITVTW